jgi:hypothetical protein
MQERIDGIDRGLLQTKTVLDPEESKVHINDLPETETGFVCRHGIKELIAELWAAK